MAAPHRLHSRRPGCEAGKVQRGPSTTNKESPTMPRILAAILLVAVLAIGGGIIATTAYQAGLGTAITTATGSAGTAVTPVVVAPAYGYGYGYGPGWHPGFGFGFFGFLATLFFLFIVFALLRAIFW